MFSITEAGVSRMLHDPGRDFFVIEFSGLDVGGRLRES